MAPEIRPASIVDKENILSVIGSHKFKWDKRIAERYYDDYFSNILKDDKVYVLTSNEKIKGVIGYSLDRYETGHYWLGWFYVHENDKEKRNGKKLLKYIIKELKGRGVKRLFVDTSSDKFYLPALNLYLKEGFRIEAIIQDYYGDGEDQIILSKKV